MTLPISISDWQSRGDSFSWKGHRIFTIKAGDWTNESKPVLCLIHGFPTASWDWAHQWEALAEHFRVCALDMIGFGLSDKPTNYPYAIMDQADLHEAWLDALGVERYHILAHDYGDTVAQELLARHIDRETGQGPGLRVETVIFLNGGLFPEQHRATLNQRILNSPLGGLFSQLMSRKRFGTGFNEVFGPQTKLSEVELDEYWQLMNTNGSIKRIGHRLIRYIQDRRQYRERWVGALTANVVPMRVIDGALDPVSGIHMVDHYKQLVARPDCIVIDTVGHYPQLEAPDIVLKAVLDFYKIL